MSGQDPAPHRIAVKYDAVELDHTGRVAGHDAGATLVRRILRVFPDSILIGPGPRRCAGFDLMPLEFCDPARTVLISMDVLDSLEVWRTMRRSAGPGDGDPRVMNFLWWPPSARPHPVDSAALALSVALLPTLADSERTAHEVGQLVRILTVPALSERARLGWVNLGFRLDHVRERDEAALAARAPVVLYPATYLSPRKRPELFLQILTQVHDRVRLRAEVRVHESDLTCDLALRMSQLDWVWVGPLTATREGYWQDLSRATAFLATSEEESYGMAYVEALAAGVVGIFPDLPWARALLPDGYPYFYRTRPEAVDLLTAALRDPTRCRAEVDAAVGGSLAQVLRTEHSDATFDRGLRARVQEWFG